MPRIRLALSGKFACLKAKKAERSFSSEFADESGEQPRETGSYLTARTASRLTETKTQQNQAFWDFELQSPCAG
jgi:hypothetical protein